MDQELQNNLRQQYQGLPLEVQKAIADADLPARLQEIVRNNKLMIDQAGKLEIETTLVLFGLEPLESYVDNLVKNIGFSKTQALIVAHDVNESIFKNVREVLKKINEQAIAAENAKIAPNEPTKEEIISRIEEPLNIKTKEESISVSSLKSNANVAEAPADLVSRGVEVRREILPEIGPESILPKVSFVAAANKTININASPVQNIVQSKMEEPVIVPKKIIIVEEKAKLPEKEAPKTTGDPYREPII
jgi:hypothetical protein